MLDILEPEVLPFIEFKTINEFIQFCSLNKLNPVINLLPKKHSNMRGEFFHILKGQLKLNNFLFSFKIEEILVKKEKLFKKEEGYLLSEII